MLILAIDTALDACSAAILDTQSARLIAHESQPMQRGHAEALMPLIARVMKHAAMGFFMWWRVAARRGAWRPAREGNRAVPARSPG